MVCEKAFAKVNLGLKVIGKRDDGYHDLEMVMTSIDLFDELAFRDNDETKIVCYNEVCNLEDNLIYKTIKLMQERFFVTKKVLVNLNKNIPIGGGLAGGSSDAAATIRGLNKLWNLNLTYQEMYDIAMQLGSDVPFCLTGNLAFVKGRGEIIEPLKTNFRAKLILVFPDYNCYTKDVFSEYKHCEANFNIENLIEAIYQKDLNSIGKYMHNDLEKVVNRQVIKKNKTPITEIKNILMQYGCIGATMSGSGSTVVGLLKNDEIVENLVKKVVQTYPNFISKIVEMV